MTKIPVMSPDINRKDNFKIAQEKDRVVIPPFNALPHGKHIVTVNSELEKILKDTVPYPLKMVSLDGKFWVEAVRITITVKQTTLNDTTYHQPILHYGDMRSVVVGNLYSIFADAVQSILFKRLEAREIIEDMEEKI